MTFQSRVHTSMVHPAVDMSITLLPHLFFSQVHGSACLRDSVGIGAVVVLGAALILEGDVVVVAIVVVKVFGSAVVSKTIVVVAAAVDCRAFAGDGVAVVVEDDVKWSSFLFGKGEAAVVLRTAIRFVFLFLQKNKQK